ncbi:MAG: Crp/Fnr family transcriptional regulator [Bacteroidales bacterium]|nr:Crp/Fnr family transcriptional regulator [Bacteroidales bacterium]
MKTLSESDKDFIYDIHAPCFQSLSPEEMEIIKESRTQVLFRKGENLTKQGAFASYVLFIISGLVKQYIEGTMTRNVNLSLLQTGDLAGLSVVFDQQVFNYSTQALKDTQVFLINKPALDKIVKKNGLFAHGIIKRYCEQNNMLLGTLKNMMYKQMNGRLADTLLYLSDVRFANEDVFSLLSRRDIADFAGISVESTVKLLKTFEKDGLIRLDDKNITIVNREALLEISKRG